MVKCQGCKQIKTFADYCSNCMTMTTNVVELPQLSEEEIELERRMYEDKD